jgi:hypothetical protein
MRCKAWAYNVVKERLIDHSVLGWRHPHTSSQCMIWYFCRQQLCSISTLGDEKWHYQTRWRNAWLLFIFSCYILYFLTSCKKCMYWSWLGSYNISCLWRWVSALSKNTQEKINITAVDNVFIRCHSSLWAMQWGLLCTRNRRVGKWRCPPTISFWYFNKWNLPMNFNTPLNDKHYPQWARMDFKLAWALFHYFIWILLTYSSILPTFPQKSA